jgi:transcriptional regulator with XRE-family HTH domain
MRVGAVFRAVRLKLKLRQADVAAKAGVSTTTYSRLETGQASGLTLGTLERVATVLQIRLDLRAYWRGGDLDRMLNSGHALMHELVAERLAGLGWEVAPEVSFNVYGERGVVDILAWHAETRTLLVIELKTQIVDINDLMATVDRKRRLAHVIGADRGWRPARVGAWVVIADTPTNRRRVLDHSTTMRAAFPADGRAVGAWLRQPDRPIAALSFLANSYLRGANPGRRRVRRDPGRGRA